MPMLLLGGLRLTGWLGMLVGNDGENVPSRTVNGKVLLECVHHDAKPPLLDALYRLRQPGHAQASIPLCFVLICSSHVVHRMYIISTTLSPCSTCLIISWKNPTRMSHSCRFYLSLNRPRIATLLLHRFHHSFISSIAGVEMDGYRDISTASRPRHGVAAPVTKLSLS